MPVYRWRLCLHVQQRGGARYRLLCGREPLSSRVRLRSRMLGRFSRVRRPLQARRLRGPRGHRSMQPVFGHDNYDGHDDYDGHDHDDHHPRMHFRR
jgi:hypothetical protein